MGLKSYLRNKYIWVIGLGAILIWRLSSGYFSQAVEIYTDSKVRNYAEGLIAESIEERLLNELNDGNLFIENYDSNGNVSYAYIDSYKINKIRNDVILYTDEAINEINDHQDFGYIEVPLGYFFGIKYFLADGVRVPIDLEVIGNQDVELDMQTLSKGINTTIVQINLNIDIHIQVVIPFQSKITTTSTIIPLAIQIMNNDIPYYLGDLFN